MWLVQRKGLEESGTGVLGSPAYGTSSTSTQIRISRTESAPGKKAARTHYQESILIVGGCWCHSTLFSQMLCCMMQKKFTSDFTAIMLLVVASINHKFTTSRSNAMHFQIFYSQSPLILGTPHTALLPEQAYSISTTIPPLGPKKLLGFL